MRFRGEGGAERLGENACATADGEGRCVATDRAGNERSGSVPGI